MVFCMPRADKVMEIKFDHNESYEKSASENENFHKNWGHFKKLGRRMLKIYCPNIKIRYTIKPMGKESPSKEDEGNLIDCMVLSQMFLTGTYDSVAASQRKKMS